MTRFEPTTLRTERLTLRPPEAADADDVFAAVDQVVQRWSPWSTAYTRAKALEWCTQEAFRDPAREVNFTIVPDRTGRFAGAPGGGRAGSGAGAAGRGYRPRAGA